MLGFSTIQGGGAHAAHALGGILAAAGASLLWGTMYIPYRKAYVSGMNPLSFVTIFTVGELGTVFALVLALDGGTKAAVFHSPEVGHMLFWLFLGGFVWVIGDIFQQFATKYLGHRPRHSALQYQPALGTGLGRAGVRRTGPCRCDASAAGGAGIGGDDPRRAGGEHRHRHGTRTRLDQSIADARVRPLRGWITTACFAPIPARAKRKEPGDPGGTTSSWPARSGCSSGWG